MTDWRSVVNYYDRLTGLLLAVKPDERVAHYLCQI